MAKTKLTRIEISRKRWLRGTENGTLRDSRGKQCCLGFVCRRAGLLAKAISAHEMPAWACPRSAGAIPKLLEPLVIDVVHQHSRSNTPVCQVLSRINDDSDIWDSKRERQLILVAKSAGYHFVFVD